MRPGPPLPLTMQIQQPDSSFWRTSIHQMAYLFHIRYLYYYAVNVYFLFFCPGAEMDGSEEAGRYAQGRLAKQGAMARVRYGR